MKTILITGGAGFVGSNLSLYLKDKYPQAKVIVFDNFIRKGSELNVDRLKLKDIEIVKGDVRNKEELFALDKIDLIVECSAEPAVLAGYNDPTYTIDTNFNGVINCLELARRDNADFVFLSTSRVYSIDALNAVPMQEKETRFDWDIKGIDEGFSIKGVRSLYGSSKLAAEHMILEYADMFDLRAVINRLGVIAGPWQMGKIDQGILGFWLAQHMYDGKLSYIGYGGTGKQVRDVLHVDDVCALVDTQTQQWDKSQGQVFNAGGGRDVSFSLLELTEQIQKMTGKQLDIGNVSETRKSDIKMYITDNSYVHQTLGWSPQKSLQDILIDTKAWIENNFDVLRPIIK